MAVVFCYYKINLSVFESEDEYSYLLVFLILPNFYFQAFSKKGSTLRTFKHSDLVPRVTLIVPFVRTVVIVYGVF